MENGGGNLPPAKPKASRRCRKCPSTMSSVLGKSVRRISRMEGPLPRLRILPDDKEGTGKAVNLDHNDEVPAGGLRFGNMELINDTKPDAVSKTSTEGEVPTVPKAGGLRFGDDSSSTNLPMTTYDERESVESEPRDSIPESGCCHRPEGRTKARNTMGFASYMKAATRCSLDRQCDEDCGYGTGCAAECRDDHGIEPESLPGSLTIPSLGLTGMGGPSAYPGLPARQSGSPGYGERQGGYPIPDGRSSWRDEPCTDSSCPWPKHDDGGQLNFYVMLLLEVFCVLIFFALCTITFWVTLVYHFVKLLVELKNADRNIQVAVAIAFGLLFLAFAICHVTSGRSGCCGRSSERSHHFWSKGGSCHKCNAKSNTPTIAKFLLKIKKVLSFSCGSCNSSSSSRKQSTPCGAKKEVARSTRKPRYSDCEGRAIFINSRRYAIPTEMKQPPTILIWLLDVVGRYM
ncbi:uncharacterized protein [Drosophila kikkawai]|uniref:Uncharacterized protein n=1 Tax=Drosophila kikkawai TaxID=30033 RepID=A0A6P4JH91_DROKI|nr:uncharacterized protein LOC108083079 [Drosophila kikkawai]